MKLTDRQKARAVGAIIPLLRLLLRSLRIRLDDRAGFLARTAGEPVIWTVWHNRVLIVPYLRERFTPERPGTVLTSPSGDGRVLAEVARRFGLKAVFGSSSKRGWQGLRQLAREIRNGRDGGITPDGPRGPRYRVQPGVLHLAHQTGAPLLPVSIEFAKSWRLRSWDGFFIPKPFAKVDVIYHPLCHLPSPDNDSEFREQQQSLERQLHDQTLVK